ncbi:MAG: prolyl oligopeptidase family serine peptidase [Oscillospiraceae bacterium]|jgi:predicted esterase|nr:prolyl oligopeptidase family serine peptidase [Oscillospiraceae bacterium]
MKKIICFSGVEAPHGVESAAATASTPAHNLYNAIVDGELTKVRVLPHKDLFGREGYAVWPGPFECEIGADGFVSDVRHSDELLTGYSLKAASGGAITLGVEETQYGFVSNAPVYIVENASVITDYKTTVERIETDWSANWWIRLNDAGLISTMWIFRQMRHGKSDPLLDEIKKFKPAKGPITDGMSIEYTYFEPRNPNGNKLPVFVWFHGLHGGTSIWTSHFEWNPIASWASGKFQGLFNAGGCYIIVPKANEDLRPGHNQAWNDRQAEPFMKALEDFLAKHESADPAHVYVGGYSMGGIMTWITASAYPEKFAAALPCCGCGEPDVFKRQLERLENLPVWAFAGKGDTKYANLFEEHIPSLIEKAKKNGIESRLTILPEGYLMPDGKTRIPHDHCVWIPMFNNMLFDSGEPYGDKDGAAVPSTVIDWLNNY